MRHRSTLPSFALAISLALGLAACDSGKKPTAPTTTTVTHAVMPDPTTPTLAVQDIKWVMEKVDAYHYGELFTDDFLFVFGSGDLVGNNFPDRALRRAEELQSANHMLGTGTGTHPRATSASLTLNGLSVFDDGRPGKDPNWHKEVRCTVVLKVNTGDDEYDVTGPASFFVVRGDSAAIPAELQAQGFGPSPSHWWIERWEDRTGTVNTVAPTGIAGTQPTRQSTWGALKAIYLQ